MSDELFYTSAVRGLRAGTSGFCTVAATSGLGPAWQQRLEAISGYKALYPVGHPQAGANPVAYSHTILSVAGQTRSVLTRAAFAGADHTGRSNKFVHHLLPTDRERGPGGPAFALRQRGVMADAFAGAPRPLPAGRAVPMTRPTPGPATNWQQTTGDAAWAAFLARAAAADPNTIVYLIYSPGTDVLALFDEALRLLPESRRWSVTFNTYVTEPPAGPCAWRGLVAGTPAVGMAKGTVLDLTTLNPADLPTGPLADTARTGQPTLTESAMTDAETRTETPAATAGGRVAMPRNVPRSPVGGSPAFDMATPAAATPRVRGGANIPSNIRLSQTKTTASKSKAHMIIGLAAAFAICATAAGVGVWFKKDAAAKLIAASQPSSEVIRQKPAEVAPSQEDSRLVKTPPEDGEVQTNHAVDQSAQVASTHQSEEAEAARNAAAKLKEKNEAKDKAEAARVLAQKKKDDQAAADRAAAEATAREANEAAARKKADEAEKDRLAAAKKIADELALIQQVAIGSENRDVPVEWAFESKPILKFAKAKGLAIFQANAARPWTPDFKKGGNSVQSVVYTINIKNGNYIGVLDNATMNFTISVNGSDLQCDFLSRRQAFVKEILDKANAEIKAERLKDVQLQGIKDTLQNSILFDGVKVKVAVPKLGSYMVSLKNPTKLEVK